MNTAKGKRFRLRKAAPVLFNICHLSLLAAAFLSLLHVLPADAEDMVNGDAIPTTMTDTCGGTGLYIGSRDKLTKGNGGIGGTGKPVIILNYQDSRK